MTCERSSLDWSRMLPLQIYPDFSLCWKSWATTTHFKRQLMKFLEALMLSFLCALCSKDLRFKKELNFCPVDWKGKLWLAFAIDPPSCDFLCNSFSRPDFRHCPFAWMLCGRIANKDVNRVHKRVLCILLKDNREFTQHDAPADDEPKKSRNERGHTILSQALARIRISR